MVKKIENNQRDKEIKKKLIRFSTILFFESLFKSHQIYLNFEKTAIK